MATNYFWRTNICACCNRYDEYHLGKTSAGWTFLFQGYEAYEPTSYAMSEERWPFKVQVTSRRQWIEIVIAHNGEIWNQYGDKMDDPVKWLSELKPPDAKQLAHERTLMVGTGGFFQTVYERRYRKGVDNFRDIEQFRFSMREFA